MQLVSSRIWTRVAVSTSYDDNHHTTGTSCGNKNYTSYIEQILKVTPHETTAIRPLSSYLKTIKKTTKTCGTQLENKNKLRSNVLQWILSPGRASVGRPLQTYQQQPCTDTGCYLDELAAAMDDKDG